MIGYDITRQGRYRCTFCPHHRSWVSRHGVDNHLESKHPTELALAQKDAEIERLKNKPPKVEVREKIVYRDAPKPKEVKYWYGVVGIYCSSCRRVSTNPGIPVGQTIENTPCSNCRNHTLMLVEEIK